MHDTTTQHTHLPYRTKHTSHNKRKSNSVHDLTGDYGLIKGQEPGLVVGGRSFAATREQTCSRRKAEVMNLK